MNTATATKITHTHTATLNGETVSFAHEDWSPVDTLVAKHGGGVPDVVAIAVPSVRLVKEEPKSSPVVAAGEMNHVGRERSEIDLAAAQASGFSPKPTVYARGSQVNSTGIENARVSRMTWEARPTMNQAATQFETRIAAERRSALIADAGKIRMNDLGNLAPSDDGSRFAMTEQAFGGLITRMGMKHGYGYLRSVWPKLRAVNVNHWAQMVDARPGKRNEIKLLTRNAMGEGAQLPREVFGAVSKKYASFTVDQVMRVLASNVGDGARSELVYDGNAMKASAVFHTDVRPEHFVAGEFFKASVVVHAKDDGSGGIFVGSALEQNLCLNLIILDMQEIEVGRIIHAGDLSKVAEKVREAVVAAKANIGHFVKKWDKAVETDVVAEMNAARKLQDAEYTPLPVSVALPGIFNGIIERELVALPKRNRTNTVDGLLHSFYGDRSAAGFDAQKGRVTRAGVVNACTHYAHTSLGAFESFKVERTAAQLLRPATRLPFVPLAES